MSGLGHMLQPLVSKYYVILYLIRLTNDLPSYKTETNQCICMLMTESPVQIYT